MNIADRIKWVRKEHLHLSQEKFGEKLGVKRDVINNIENNRLKRPELNEPIYRLICEKFGISEKWLRDGDGDPFELPDRDKDIISLMANIQLSNDDFIVGIIRAYLELPDEGKKYVQEFTHNLISLQKNIKKSS